MLRYEIIIYWSQADEAFVAEVPELPSCAADGKTYKQALANAEIITQERLETANELGRPIPAPPRPPRLRLNLQTRPIQMIATSGRLHCCAGFLGLNLLLSLLDSMARSFAPFATES